MTSDKKKIIVAIDGFSSSGKSTMARHLAKAVGYRYIDTGAMYRAVTLWAMRHALANREKGVDADSLISFLPQISLDFRVMPDSDQQVTLLNGEDVEKEIRSLEVSELVSPVAAIPGVRHRLVQLQQQMGQTGGVVMDGRDIGTVVFPQAQLKIYCDASPEERARRRVAELAQKGQQASYEQVLKNVLERDHIDSTRSEGPLRCAPDAIRLNNSAMTIEQQDAFLLELFQKTLQNHG